MRKVIIVASVVFVCNLIWEFAQMPFYVTPSIYPWCCVIATLWDVIIVGGLYLLVSLVFRRSILDSNITDAQKFLLVTLGFILAVFIEQRAVSGGHWAYQSTMPLIPFTKIGITPVLQMMLLPVFALELVQYFKKSAN